MTSGMTGSRESIPNRILSANKPSVFSTADNSLSIFQEIWLMALSRVTSLQIHTKEKGGLFFHLALVWKIPVNGWLCTFPLDQGVGLHNSCVNGQWFPLQLPFQYSQSLVPISTSLQTGWIYDSTKELFYPTHLALYL